MFSNITSFFITVSSVIKITRFILLLLTSNTLLADDVTIIAPQNYISDFPNEQISVQTLRLSMVYDDVVIPGNGGLDLVVTRRIDHGKFRIDTTTLAVTNVAASSREKFSEGCLGTFDSLTVKHNNRILVAAGYNSSTQFPSSAIAMFDNNSYLSCEGSNPTLHLPTGRKITFTRIKSDVHSYFTNPQYVTGRITDRYGNYIDYEYENDEKPASYYSPKRIKKITRNDGQVVNFVYMPNGPYNTSGGFQPESLSEINYSGKVLEYEFLGSSLKTFTDAEGRKTEYTYSLTNGVGTQIDTITTPEGLVIKYRFRPGSEAVGARLPLGEDGSTQGYLSEKSISGPGIDLKWYIYIRTINNESLAIQSNYKGDIDLTTKYTIQTGHFNNAGQLLAIRRYAGKFTNGDIRGQYRDHELIYEKTNLWQKINTNNLGCHPATHIFYFTTNDCSRYIQSDTSTRVNNSSVFDTYIEDVTAFNAYGNVTSVTEKFNAKNKVTVQSYDHDVSRWILNQPRILKLGTSSSNLKNVRETSYYSKNHASYPFMPYEFKSFDVWKQRYTQYHSFGDVKKIEYNEKLNFGDTSLNRYQLFTNYNRGIAQTISVPSRYFSTPMNATKVVDVNGWITQETDYEGNVVNYGFDNIGRLKYEDPEDDKWSDTFITWSLVGGNTKVTKKCTLNIYNTGCSGTSKVEGTITFDAKMRPIKTRQYDVKNNKSVYQNYSYNVFDRKIFESFLSEDSNEVEGSTFDYDNLQRLTSTSISHGGTQTNTFLSKNRIKTNDFRGKETTTTYLAYGQQEYRQAIEVISPESTKTVLDVDVYGNIKSITQSGLHKNTTISQTQTNLYDDNQNLCMVKRTDVGNTYYKYNALDEMVWFAQGVSGSTCSNHLALSSQKITIGYDNNGNQHTKTYADGTPQIKTTLDKNGNVKNLTSGSVNQAYEYNSAKLLEKETLNVDGKSLALDYDYNSLGHLDSLVYPSLNKIYFAPNAFGQSTKAGSYVTSAQYHPNGQIDTFNYGNGLTYRQTLDDQKRPYNLSVNKGSVSRLSQTYTYDNSNNIEHIYDNTNHYYDIDLGYDDMDRLDYANSNAWGSGSFSYDGLGNLTGKTLGVQNLTYNYNTKKQLSTVTGAVSYNFQYNKDGSVKHNGRYGLTYNRANQLKNANGNNYVYDGNNRLVKKTSSGQATYSFYSLEGTLYQVIPADGNITEYIYLGDKLVAKELAFKEIDNNPIYKYKPISPTHLSGSATTCSFFTGCSLYISWKHSNVNNVTYFELDQRGDSNTGECSNGNVCLDSVAPVKQLTLIKIDNEWVRIYNDKSLFNRPTIKGASAGYRVRACNPVGCSSYSAVITVSADTSI